MNDYRVRFALDGIEHLRELSAESVRHIDSLLPEDAEVLEVKFLRARGFSCRPRGDGVRRR